MTYQRLCCDTIGDDDYGQWTKTLGAWMLGENGDGDGVWEMEAWYIGALGGMNKVGKFPVRVEKTLLSENGVPVGSSGSGGERRRVQGVEKKVEGGGKNLRSSVVGEPRLVNIPARENRRRLHHDDCVTAYYHVESLLEMTKVTYTQPKVLEDITDPIANFLGYENVKTMTLYNEPEPFRIDVIPWTEYTLHNFEGFDCSQFRQPVDYWEDLWMGFLAGDAGNVAIVVGAGSVATGGFAFVIWIFVFGGSAGGAGLRGWVGGGKGGKGGERGRGDSKEVEGADDFGRDTEDLGGVGGKNRATSAFENTNPMASAHVHGGSRGKKGGAGKKWEKKWAENHKAWYWENAEGTSTWTQPAEWVDEPLPPPPPAGRKSSMMEPKLGVVKTFQKIFLRKNSSMATEKELELVMEMSHKPGKGRGGKKQQKPIKEEEEVEERDSSFLY